jgi:hypothetical protein
MWRAIGRIIIVPVAFLLSALVAIFVLLTIGLEQLTHATGAPIGNLDDPDHLFQLWDIGAIGLSLVSGATIIPALLAVVVGEVARIRSWIYYVLAGGLALVAIPLLAGLAGTSSPDGATAPTLFVSAWPIFATAGFAAGGLYWLLAGRNA